MCPVWNLLSDNPKRAKRSTSEHRLKTDPIYVACQEHITYSSPQTASDSLVTYDAV